ncbi:MAG TPA: hypothetical protein VGN80_05550 [Devosiaceae bacterium]|nr:hypothetical protein [Devosiaceae bacterium]
MSVFRAIIACFLTAALLAFVAVPLVAADEAADRTALDRLFAELQAAPDAATAHDISQRIWIYWTTPADPELALRMGELLAARRVGDLDRAITLANGLIADYPDYAEAWNQRATLHYMRGELDASLTDCAEVLLREPRHFGALSGRALIYLQQGERMLALKDMAAAVAIHPFLSERRLFPELQQKMTRI